MKRTWMLTLVVVLIAAMTACSSKSSTPTSTNNSGVTNSGSNYVMPKTADTPTPAATLDSNQKSWSPIFIVTSQNPKSVAVTENGGELDFQLGAKDLTSTNSAQVTVRLTWSLTHLH